MNDILINFRIPTDLKHDFSSVCRVNHTTMTSELIRFVKSYLDDERVKFETNLKNRHRLRELMNKQSTESAPSSQQE